MLSCIHSVVYQLYTMAKFTYALVTVALLGLASAMVIDPECPEHEYLSQNTPICPVTCQTRRSVHCLGLKLVPSCQCAPGYLRDSTNGKCVPAAQCPQKTEDKEIAQITPEEREKIRASCDAANEDFTEVTSACPAHCFGGHVIPSLCMALIHTPSCQCRSGYVRHSITKKCILTSECKNHLD